MSRLDEMIAELCPDGVKYIRLNTVCNIYDGTHQTPNYTESGVKFISVENIDNIYVTEKYISEDDYNKYKIKSQINDVFMTRIGNIGTCAVVEKNIPIAYYVSLALLRPNTKVLNSKYLKYYIESKYGRKELYKRTLVNAIPIKINMGDIGKIMIKLPPLEVQREIVRILDSFTELEKELEKELELRKKQYKYYSQKLLTNNDNAIIFKLSDLCEIKKGKTPIQKAISGKYPMVVTTTERKSCNDYQFDCSAVCIPLVSSRGHGVASLNHVYYQEGKFALGNILCAVIPTDNKLLNSRYLYYYFELKKDYVLIPLMKGGANVSLHMQDIAKVKIPVPPIEEQERIVNILDRFDKLCNDISEGLPAEIEARKKQYEYYRDRLLSFREKN